MYSKIHLAERLLPLITIAALASCGGDDGMSPDQIAMSLSLSATADTVLSLSSTLDYTATALDADGNSITTGFTWSSSDPGVAAVTGTSNNATATAIGDGTTTIRVERDSLSAEATLVVEQTLAAVVITPDSALIVETLTEQLSASPQDANGNAMLGLIVTWTSTDAIVAAVDTAGLVTGQSAGAASVVAEVDGMTDTASVTVETPSLAQHVQPIFTANCATSGCHTGATPAEGVDLSDGQTFASVVNVQSTQVNSLKLVKPNQPGSSYLINKLEGTQDSVGGSGSQQPPDASPLSQDVIDIVRAWITRGANNN